MSKEGSSVKSYRYTGESRVFVPDLEREVEPGEVVRTEVAIQNANFEQVTEPRRSTREE